LVIAGWQRGLSLLLGFGMLFFALMAIFRPVLFHSNRFTAYVGNRLAPVMGRVMARAGFGTSFVFGLLNGLLPCGLLYVALSAAAATGSAVQSALFMGVFGLATIPLMLFLVLFSAQLGIQYRNQVRRLLPVFTALVAVLLILRGLDLGIPYLSPQIDGLPDGTRSAEAASCH
jgi:sulfite exporter TauE/SafE